MFFFRAILGFILTIIGVAIVQQYEWWLSQSAFIQAGLAFLWGAMSTLFCLNVFRGKEETFW